MKKYLLFITIAFINNSCSKDSALAETKVALKMIQDKSWFLDYDQTGTVIKTYVGQSTYYINFLKNGTTQDSDGLNGTYTVEKINNQIQIHVQAKTIYSNPIEYIYDVISVGSENLILSYTLNSKKTQLYFTSKR